MCYSRKNLNGEGGRRMLRTYLKKHWKFFICHFTLGNFRESKTSPLDNSQSCVAPLFLDHCWKFYFFLNWPLNFNILFFNTPGNNPQPPLPIWIFSGIANADQTFKMKVVFNLKSEIWKLRLWTCRICIF